MSQPNNIINNADNSDNEGNNNNKNNNNTTLDCRISPKDRRKISRDYKKIKCLDTLAKKYKCSINQIEKIVKVKKKPGSVTKANSHLVSLLDNVIYEWFQRAQRLIETGPITDEMILQKAHESTQIFGIPNFLPDYEWVRNFRKKYNITKLDMTMLRIENDNKSLSVDINEIIMFVLENNPIRENFSYPNLQDNTKEIIIEMSSKNDRIANPTQYLIYNNNLINESIMAYDSFGKPAEDKIDILPVITNDEQAKRHLKPLEDYVLLKENFRAIGLISQLEEIFAEETNKQ